MKNCGCRPKPHHVAGGALPAVVITLLPKCPACLAAYLALASGLAISAGAVAFVELLFVLLSLLPLLYLVIRRARATRHRIFVKSEIHSVSAANIWPPAQGHFMDI